MRICCYLSGAQTLTSPPRRSCQLPLTLSSEIYLIGSFDAVDRVPCGPAMLLGHCKSADFHRNFTALELLQFSWTNIHTQNDVQSLWQELGISPCSSVLQVSIAFFFTLTPGSASSTLGLRAVAGELAVADIPPADGNTCSMAQCLAFFNCWEIWVAKPPDRSFPLQSLRAFSTRRAGSNSLIYCQYSDSSSWWENQSKSVLTDADFFTFSIQQRSLTAGVLGQWPRPQWLQASQALQGKFQGQHIMPTAHNYRNAAKQIAVCRVTPRFFRASAGHME